MGPWEYRQSAKELVLADWPDRRLCLEVSVKAGGTEESLGPGRQALLRSRKALFIRVVVVRRVEFF